MVLTVLVVVLVPLSSVLADGGSPTSKPLGLTDISAGWHAGMMVIIGSSPVYAGPYGQEKLGTIPGVVKGQIPSLPPRVVRNWSAHQLVTYAVPLEVNNRVAVLPLGEAFDHWRGIGWVPKAKVTPLAIYQGQFDERESQPSLHLCSQ
ncbi:MAG TPA: hypothetical protein VMW04_01015 [Patescibacteria group bacterium]|nr:hypothetical protein [Patescibacteria group bacterium]